MQTKTPKPWAARARIDHRRSPLVTAFRSTLARAAFGALAIGFCQCAFGQAEAEVPRNPAVSRDNVAPFTDQEITAFSNAVETAVASGDPAQIDALIDWGSLADFASATPSDDLPLAAAQAKWQQKLLASTQEWFSESLAEGVTPSTPYRRLAVLGEAPYQRVVFCRLEPQGIQQFARVDEWRLWRLESGEVVALDVLCYRVGEWLSVPLRRSFLLATQSSLGTARTELSADDQAFLDHQNKLEKWLSAPDASAEEIAGSLKLYDYLPYSVQKQPWVQIRRIRLACRGADAAAVNRAMRQCESILDDRPVTHWILAEAAGAAARGDLMLYHIDRMEKRLGQTPVFDLLRGIACTMSQKPADAAVEYGRVVKAAPEYQPAYWLLLTSQLRARDFSAATRSVDELQSRFHVRLDELDDLPNMDSFLRSSEYQDWIAARKSAAESKESADRPNSSGLEESSEDEKGPGKKPADEKDGRDSGSTADP